jgi:hypothetical protein
VHQRRFPLAAVRLDVLVVAAVFAALTILSWRKWPDPLIDFGRELYTPWQLANGKLLHRDVATLFGPFSQYFNALWFALVGPSLTTLIVVNLTILALLACGIRHFVLTCCDRYTATAATLVTLLLFGFSQYVEDGNYNFIAPYSHEATHSVALAVGVLILLLRGIQSGRRLPFGTAGVLLGFVFLTRAETSIAIACAVGVAFAGWRWIERENERLVMTRALLTVGAALLPAIAFFAYFCRHMTAPEALRAVAGSWATLLTTTAADNRFYLASAGLDNPGANAVAMLTHFGGFLVFVAVACGVDRVWPVLGVWRVTWRQLSWRTARAVLLVASFVWAPWGAFPRALPLIVAAAGAVLLLLFTQRRNDRSASLSLLALLAWAAFALVLLGKILLNARIHHYGFYLSLPAVVLLVIVVLWLVPSRLVGRGGAEGRIFRSLAALMLASAVGSYVAISQAIYMQKDQVVGSGPDRFYALDTPHRGDGRTISAALSRIRERIPPDATVAVLPEGVMINYLARRANPTPYITFMLPELSAFGDERMLAALATERPDYIVLISRDTSEYGVLQFGLHPTYGKAIMDWITRHYRTIELIGDRPVGEGGRGAEILVSNLLPQP